MAAKKGYDRKPTGLLTDTHRLKIQNSNILSVLVEHVQGKREMGATQVTAAIALLRKVLPDLTATELTGGIATYVARLPTPSVSVEDWKETIDLNGSQSGISGQPVTSQLPITDQSKAKH
jgi:hypothetical protein